MKESGFSLIEVLVAMAIVLLGVAPLAHLLVIAADTSRLAGTSSMALFLAREKLESLRADSGGLDPSPPGALVGDTSPYVEYLDSSGASVGPSVGSPPPGVVFVRRWSIEPLPGSAREAMVLQVLVIPWTASGNNARGAARLVTMKARKG